MPDLTFHVLIMQMTDECCFTYFSLKQILSFHLECRQRTKVCLNNNPVFFFFFFFFVVVVVFVVFLFFSYKLWLGIVFELSPVGMF